MDFRDPVGAVKKLISGQIASGLSDLESNFTCMASGRRGADIRPPFPASKDGNALMLRRLRLPAGRSKVTIFLPITSNKR